VIRTRFAPSPTGPLHLGGALSAVASRRLGEWLLLRIDDTDRGREIPGSADAIAEDLRWLGVEWDEGPVRQSERAARHVAAARAIGTEDEEGALRFGRVTLLRPDGSPTYHLASVVDDHDYGITHVVRGTDHRPNVELQQELARALGFDPPEYVHHGLLLGGDGRKLSKRNSPVATIVELRDAGIPSEAARAYLEELGTPAHDVQLDLPRLRRLAIDAIAGLPDAELAALADAPVELARALRGARDLVEAKTIARTILEPAPASLPDAWPTLERFAELRQRANGGLDEDAARWIVRELKAVGGDLKALRVALTGAERGPELWTVIAALPREEALRRASAAL
jgi:glutamyl-tRNA synthetase